MTGTPTETARLRAATLLPSVRMVSGVGPMKTMPGRGAGLGEFRALREKAVARMDRVDLGLLRDPDHLVDRQIGFEGSLAEADLIGLVRLEAVQRELVLLGIDRDRRNAQFGRGAEHADGDFAAIGDE